MSQLIIRLPDERLTELKEKAARLGVAPEDLVRVSVQELLDRPDEAFQQAVKYVLAKNQELYQRLA